VEPNDEVEARVRADIEAYGWHVAMVPPERGTPGWALSVGLFERYAHPEILVFGPELPVLLKLVNRLGAHVGEGAHFAADSEHEGILEGQFLAFRAIAPKWYGAFLGNAAWHYRSEDFPAVQCFWPDAGGAFPWQPGSDPAWRDQQPQLFHTETHRVLSERLIDLLRSEGAL